MTDEQTQEYGFAPSGSTNATLIGGALAAITIGVLGKIYGIYFEAGFEAGLAVIFATLVGYLPKSGRLQK